jgi:hypothetical protein
VFASKATLAGGTLSAPSVSLESGNSIDLGSSTDTSGVMSLSSSDLAGIGTGSSGTLSVSVNSVNPYGDITISQPLTVAGNLSLYGQRNVVVPSSVAVDGTFTLYSGQWTQNSASLPAFSAHDFQVAGGSFLRALGGDGAGGTPYLLADIYGVQGVSSVSSIAAYKLNNNIDASGTTHWNGGLGFYPLFDFTTSFNGVFDGNNKTISNLAINRTGSVDHGTRLNNNEVGLFGVMYGGTIKDLTLDGGSVAGYWRVGSVVGFAQVDSGGVISNVHSSATVSGHNGVGGLAGYNGAAISNSSASGAVSSYSTANTTDADEVGGLVGLHAGSISNSWASGNVTGVGNAVGGLVGTGDFWNAPAGASIYRSFAKGNVSASGVGVGGLIGENRGGNITESYAVGDVLGGGLVGGLVGRNSTYGNSAGGKLTDVYATGNVSGLTQDSEVDHSYMGGLMGYMSSGSLVNGFSSGGVNGTGFTSGTVGAMFGQSVANSTTVQNAYFNGTTAGITTDVAGTALTTAQSMRQDSYAGFDFVSSTPVWRIYEGHAAPLLKSFLTPITVAVTGSGSTKVYDGSTATFGQTYTHADISGTLGYDGAVNAGSYNVGGLYSTKYDISYDGTAPLLITPRPVTASVSATKTYDGIYYIEGQGTATYTFNNLVGADTLGIQGRVDFNNKSAGSKTVSVYSPALTGNELGNYTLSGTVTGTGTISPRPLALSDVVVQSTRVYNGSAVANFTGGNAIASGLSGDDVALATVGTASAHFNNKSVGEGKPVTVAVSGYTLTGNDAGNYVVSGPAGLTGSVTAAPLTISDLVANNRVYNLTYDTGAYSYGTAATLSGTLSGVLGSDVVTLGSSSSFANRNVGTAKPVTVRSLTLGGTDGGNYQIITALPTGLTANITPATLTITGLTADSRPYDATTVAALSGGTLGGVLSAAYGEGPIDSVTLVRGAAAFADKNVGVDKAVNLSGALSLSGASAGNYQLQLPTNVKATITARALSTFNAASGGLWSDAGNWVDGIAPDGANVLAAAIQSGSGTITYDASAGSTTLTDISIGSGRNLALTGGALTITGTGGKSYATGATLTLNGGSLVLNGSLDGTYLALTSGTISGTNSSANLYVNNLTQTGGSIDMSGSLNIINGNSIAIGSVRAQSGITLNAGEGGTITQTGPLVTDSLHAMATNGITLTNTGNHVGAFSATNYSGDIRLNNTVSSGELALGPLSTTGNIIIDNHGGIHTAGTIHAIHSGANTGLVSIAAHSPITVNDTIDGSDIGLSASTSITLAPGTSLQSTNTIGLTAGTGIAMDSSSVVNSGSSIALTAGTGIVLGGSLSVASGGSISATAASGSITASSGTSLNSSGGTIILAAPQGSVTTPNVTFTGVQPTVTDGAAAAAAAAQAAAAAAAAQAAADAAAKAAADAAAKAAADAAAAAAAQAAADAAAKAAADAAAKAAADAAAKAAADAAAAQAAADAAKAAADAAAKAAADAAAKAAADAAAKAAADAAAKAAADAAAQAAADAAAKAASDAAAKTAADAAAKAAADAAAKAAADAAAAAAAAAAGSSTPTPVAQALNSTVNIINTVTTTVQANKNTPATVPPAPDTTVANTGTGSGSGGNSKPDDKVPDAKTTDKKDDSGTTAIAKNEPAKKMYCN